ncbi:extracellular solute-binding protein [Paenibacillus thermoaerophilus]|uniref:Extracellular solute-binding protein n=1 Tax=Paenibacillus thermoaerophilus TaxID=1215385 RepID=A0ABW2V5H2_9BACL|nr:extracellular solute-binding protein [Paenibacillus thermoaerophilus]
MAGAKRRGKGSASAVALLLAMSVAAAGCSKGDGGSASSSEPNASQGPSAAASGNPAEKNEPFKITMSMNFDGKDIPNPNNPVQQAIETYTNTKLDIRYTPGAQYQEKLSVLIASGDLPMVVASYGAPKQSYLLTAFENGVFWDIAPYLKEYPNLSKLNQAIYDNIAYKGKIYGLPRERPLARNAFIYRADWLENLGMQEPKTLEEFYNMLKAFKEKDPDKNGKNDTYGLSTGNVGGSGPEPSAYGVVLGAPNVWEVRNGEFIRDVFTPEYLEGLKFQKRLFEEGLIHPDFAMMDRPKMEGEFENGKAGVIYNTTNVAVSYEARVKAHFPDAKISFFSLLANDKGEKRIAGAMGSNGILMFPKSSVKTEAELKRILKFFDQLADKEMADLLEWGIVGKHSQRKDGKYEMINQEAFDNEVAFPYKWPLRVVALDAIKSPGIVNPLVEKEIQVTEENKKYVVNNPTNAILSATFTERGVELEQIIKDANTKFIMGVIDEAKWKSEMERWKSSGGDKIAKEYAEDWAKGNK